MKALKGLVGVRAGFQPPYEDHRVFVMSDLHQRDLPEEIKRFLDED